MKLSLYIFFYCIAGGLFAQSWLPVSSGVNDEVLCLKAFGTNLYAGGRFLSAGGVSANRIARWNGISWNSLGSGTNSLVFDLHAYNNKLFACGGFSVAGGVSASKIAEWDGSAWDSLDNSYFVNSWNSMAEFGGELYVG